MMDEILATLPAVERTLIEAELEVDAAGTEAPETSFFDKGKARADRVPTSWEGVNNPSTAINNLPKLTPLDLTQLGASPISARNDMPRFGGSVSRPPDGNIFAPLSGSTSASLQAHSKVQQSPFTARSTMFPHSSSQNSRTPAPLLGLSGIKYPAPLFMQPSTPGANPTPSLFTLAGSANQTRNAFYTPSVTNGVKRSLGEDEPQPAIEIPPAPTAADESPAPVVNGDINMESEDDHARETDTTRAQGKEDLARAELSYSVFGNPPTAKQPPLKSRRLTRTETETKMPPGAYVPDDEELAATAGMTGHTQHQRHTSFSPPPPVKQTRSSRPRKPTHEPDLKRRLPGAFVSEEDNEEEDYVAPLPASHPPSKRTTKRGRSTRSAGSEDEIEPARPTRRSTRLSTTSSVASTSPEPPSSRKGVGKAKKGTKSTGTKSGSRKK